MNEFLKDALHFTPVCGVWNRLVWKLAANEACKFNAEIGF